HARPSPRAKRVGKRHPPPHERSEWESATPLPASEASGEGLGWADKKRAVLPSWSGVGDKKTVALLRSDGEFHVPNEGAQQCRYRGQIAGPISSPACRLWHGIGTCGEDSGGRSARGGRRSSSGCRR